MLQSIDLSGTEHKSSDHQLLRAYLQQLANQPFLHFRFSYGDELSLHFGSPRKYASTRLKHLSKGSYIIAARASNWFLGVATPPSIIFGVSSLSTSGRSSTPVSKQQLETSNFVKQGARILALDPILFSPGPHSRSGFALALLLSDGSSLSICPNLDEPVDESDDVADWEVFTPYERCIEVGPGLQWAYVNTRAKPSSKTPA
jgi:hypothetical protein